MRIVREAAPQLHNRVQRLAARSVVAVTNMNNYTLMNQFERNRLQAKRTSI